ncbi:hypothetical protein M0805_006948 [Coniferiporia weirii]|nr:hypothetical protein M0805_006948 [Coniferiporia weirii]
MQLRLSLAFVTSLVIAACANISELHPEASPELRLEYAEHSKQAPYLDKAASAIATIPSDASTFAGRPLVQCLGEQSNVPFDIAILGAPFDTRHQPDQQSARLGPAHIRAGSHRLVLGGSYNVPLAVNPLKNLAIVDCGDVPIAWYDNGYALKQIEDSHKELLHRTPARKLGRDAKTREQLVTVASDGREHPRVVTLGGDHTIVLPILRSIHSAYGPISVIHFGSHLRTEEPTKMNPKTYLYRAVKEGLVKSGSSVHGAIRARLSSFSDYNNDDSAGFHRIEAQDIDTIGVTGIVEEIRNIVGNNPVYLSIDIDAIDPAFAPATSTPESGGWTTRELRAIIRGLDGLYVVSADVVGVVPVHDTNARITSVAAADVLFDVLSVMAKTPLGMPASELQTVDVSICD